jgi:hypothetical protein
MKNSSAIFQRVMEDVLRGLPGVVAYQDDLLIHATSKDLLARRVSAVLKRLEEKNVTINPEKSVLFSTEIRFLGHLLTSDGIRPDPQIADKILSCRPPKDRKELESFLGLINFFGRMVPKFSETASPLHQLRRKDTPFVWEASHQAAFESLLNSIAHPPILRSYDLSSEATLTTDASESAVGGVLTQEGRPVIYVSRTLTSAERNYSNVEREALAVVWCVLRLKQFLLGRHFTLVTDHRPLMTIYGGSSLPKVASARLTRWAILLQAYNFTVQYKAGSTIPHADAMSRLRFNADQSSAEDAIINNVSMDITLPAAFIQRVQTSMTTDTTLLRVMRRVQQNSWSNCSQRERPFLRIKNSLKVSNSLLFLGTRLVLPTNVCKDAFEQAHELHTGISSTLRRLSLNVWWPKMKADVQRWIADCSTCNSLRPRTARDISTWPQATPFERVHGDWCHVSGIGDVLILVDAASGWIEATHHRHRTSQAIISSLTDLSCRFGPPKIFVTDNGPEFVSEELIRWCQSNGVEKKETPTYHPASNGLAERAVQTIKHCLRAWKLESSHMPFEDYLKRILFHHRATCRRQNGCTPAETVFGRRIRVPLSATFSFGQQVMYKPKQGELASSSTFLVPRGSNTSWILDTNQRLRLAHSNQLAPSSSSHECQTDVETESSTPPSPSPSNTNVPPRRSSRPHLRKFPTDYEDL